ncbi:MAG: protein kinase [Anaerolineae bacterium]|nr:protein kinase [Anaerolineae bacterium]
MNDLTGTVLKGYKVQELIGAGGFGAVYRACQVTVGREVVIKAILPQLANNPEFIRRFEIEAQTIARLEHMHIAPLYDYWRDPEGAYLVMRYFRGGSLADALHDGPYALAATALLLDQVAAALAVAHRSGVIHRDLKPGNILLDEDGNAYLADFGIAKDIERSEMGLTSADVIVGSLDYISPEQARGEPVTPRTDIYSLGVVLYEVLAGEHPFPGLTSVERLYRHINDPLPVIPTLDDSVRDDVNAVIQKATAKDPARRYGDALGMAAAFREAARLDRVMVGDDIVERLTRREQEILQRMIAGASNRDIAQDLFVEITTVKWYINKIFRKLGVRSRMQCIVRARELRLVVDGESDFDLPVLTGEGTATSLLFQPENPYKGLRPFQVADTRDFFGREKLTAALVARMTEHVEFARFLAVVGPSGSGKSSVVRAGLIPALWRGELPGSERWFIVDMLPGAYPLDELEVALMRVAADQARNLHEPLTRDPRGLLRAAQLILPDDDSELLVIVDQFEEVFTLVEDEAARQHFLDLLYTAVTAPRSRVRVLITLRADFYDKPLHYPEFGEMVRSRMETILPLSADELQRAIGKPAQQVGVMFEEGLIATIVSEIHYQPGALPLLQYALTELFENREQCSLTHRAYEQIGRITGALARRADALYDELDEAGREAARQMFLRLVTLGEGAEDTRRRASRSELLAIAVDPDLMESLIDTYTGYRLLSLDHDPATRTPVVEVAHEAILREWRRLQAWLDESRHDIRQQRWLATAAADWLSAGRDPSYLLHGARLEQFSSWLAQAPLALTPEEREFLEVSVTAQHQHDETERERQARELALAREAAESARQAAAAQRRATHWLRFLVAGLAGFLVIALVLSVFAFAKEREATDSRKKAEREATVNHSLVLAANAREESEVGRGDLALALALEAAAIDEPPADVRNTLANVAFAPGTRMVLAGHQGEVTAVAFSPDGHTLLSAGCSHNVSEGGDCDRGELIQWNLDSGDRLNRWEGHTGWINAVAFAPDQQGVIRAVSASADGTLSVWDVAAGRELRRLESHSGAINDVIFVPGGQAILSASEDGAVIMWDAASGQILSRLEGHTACINMVAVSPDGMRAATASDDRTILIWDIEPASPLFGQVVRRFEGHSSGVLGVAFVSDGAAILSNSSDLSFRLWDVQTGVELRQRMIGAYGGGIAVSPNGRTVLFPIGTELYLWDTEVWWQDQLLTGHTQRIWDVAFSPDGGLAATASSDGTVRIWNIAVQEEVHRYSAEAPIFALEVSPDGSRLVAGEGTSAGNLWVFETSSAALARLIEGQGLTVAPGAIALDPGGRYALVAALETDSQVMASRLTLWDLDSGEASQEMNGRKFPYRSTAFSPDERYALVGTQDFSEDDLGGELFLLDLETWEIVRQFDTSEDITSIAFSRDGTQAISGSCYFEDATRWDIASGQAIRSYPEQPACVLSILYGPDETTIITASNDGSITEWDSQTGERIRQFVGHDGPVWSLDLSADGRLMASGSSDGSVIVWDYAGAQVVHRYTGHMGWIFDVAFSPDAGRLYSASADGTLREWQVSEWSLEDLLSWVKANRYIRDFTCEEREQYRIEPLCS